MTSVAPLPLCSELVRLPFLLRCLCWWLLFFLLSWQSQAYGDPWWKLHLKEELSIKYKGTSPQRVGTVSLVALKITHNDAAPPPNRSAMKVEWGPDKRTSNKEQCFGSLETQLLPTLSDQYQIKPSQSSCKSLISPYLQNTLSKGYTIIPSFQMNNLT